MKLQTSLRLLAICCIGLTRGVVHINRTAISTGIRPDPLFAAPDEKDKKVAKPENPVSKEPVAKELDDSLDTFGKSDIGKDKTPISTYPEHTWGHARSHLGSSCEPGGPVEQCGDGGLVCHRSHCQYCSSDSECPSVHSCFLAMSGENVCVADAEKAWDKVTSDPMHMLCSVLIFFASVLASAAGTGGGGMFVPLLVLFSVLKAENAVPLSQCMIFCSSFCNLVVFVSQRHTNQPQQPKIDYDCVVLFEPMLCLGVTFGVLLHRVSPQWFLLAALCITLGIALWRTLRKGLKQREAELKRTEQQREAEQNKIDFATARAINLWNPTSYQMEVADITESKSTQIIGIIFVWLLMFVASFHGLSPCSTFFAFFIVALTGLLVICTVLAIKYVIAKAEPPLSPKKPVDWLGKSFDVALSFSHCNFGTATFPMMAFAGGLLGGLLGLGGGVIMSPVLLEVGMHSESVQATTAMIVFLSSSLATIQFALLNQIVWHYALWYSFIAVVATIVGQRLCEVYVRRTGRYSLITLSIAGVLCFSLAALAYVGTQQVIEDVKYGNQMGWSTAGLCSSGRFPLFDNLFPATRASDIPPLGEAQGISPR